MPDGHPRHTVDTVLDGIRDVAPPGWTVTHARGANIVDLVPNPAGATYPDGQPRGPVPVPASPDADLIQAAVEAARAADVVVAVLGDTVDLTGETCSTATLELLGGQTALLEALVATGTPVVLVLVHSKPSVLPPAAEGVAAILEAFNPGMRGGTALAEILFGLTEPTGRLPISVPRHVGQQPIYYNQVRGQHGDRYADLTQEPLFAFGEGMSYTRVEYSDLVIDQSSVDMDDAVRASVTVTNRGSRPTIETVQVYVSDQVTSVTWADQELKSWIQVPLEPGEQRRVRVQVPVADCTLVTADERRVVEAGAFSLRVGSSSRARDLLSAEFTVVGKE